MRFKYYLSALALGLTAFTACKKTDVSVDAPGIELNLTATEMQKVSADNSFSLKLFKNLAAGNPATKNLMISPLSVGFALGMTSNGANGTTLDAIRSTLNFSGFTQDQVNAYYGKLITGLPLVDPKTTMNIANAIWYTQGLTVLSPFTQTNSTYYNATIKPLDFTSASSVQTINNWVSTNTNGKIPTIINQIPSDVIMYLINTIYFKGSWNQKFDVSSTQKGTFTLPDNSTVQTDFMNGTKDFNIYADGDVTVAELPYTNNRYCMDLIMPATGKSITDFVTSVDSAKFQGWMSKLTPVSKNTIVLPKFKFSYGSSLKDALTTLGMGIAFTDNADLSRISGGRAKISDVQHKTFIQVDEDGTEAAAATSVSITATAVLSHTYTFDHPFMFVIREKFTGLVLFTGIVNNPLLAGE